MSSSRIRLVLFDAFDTLVTPRYPIHTQYASVARAHGLDVSDDAVRAGFRKAFKQTNGEMKNFGKARGCTPDEWWALVIERTMRNAGAGGEELRKSLPTLTPTLLHRFASDEGYTTFEDTMPCLKALKDLNVKIGVVSNSDSRMISVLRSLHILPFLSSTTISYDSPSHKPLPEIFHHALRNTPVPAALPIRPDETLHVGDELEADYRGALSARLHALLLRRDLPEWSDGAAHAHGEDLAGVAVARGLGEVVRWVRERNEGG